MMEYLLIAVGAITAAFLLVTIVRRISAYYRQRFNMSVWAGVFMLAIAAVLIAYSLYHYQSIYVPIAIAAGVLLLITGFLDKTTILSMKRLSWLLNFRAKRAEDEARMS